MKDKYALFVRKSLRKENVVLFNNMFTLLNLNHDHKTRAAIKHLLDIPQKQTYFFFCQNIYYNVQTNNFQPTKINQNNIIKMSHMINITLKPMQ